MAKEKKGKISSEITARDRYFGAIFEDLNGKFSLLLEGYAALNARMGKLEESMDKLEIRMGMLEKRMDNFETKFEEFRTETNQRLVALFDGQQEFFEEMKRCHIRLAALEGKR